MGAREPYWRTNTSYSPPPHSRWDFRFSSEDLPYYSNDGNLRYSSSTSSDSKDSRQLGGSHHYSHQYSASDGAGIFLSSASDLYQSPQWTPPAIQEISVDDYEAAMRRGRHLQHLPSTTTMEEYAGNQNFGSSESPHSDSSESEPTFKSCISTHRNFSNRRSFLAKPIHPLSFPNQTSREVSHTMTRLSELDAATTHRDSHHWSSGSSLEISDVQEALESESFSRSFLLSSEAFKCGICEKFLSQRSPWSSRRIVRSGDMPVASVLSCRHVFHAECLEQATPRAQKSDPLCPVCVRLEENPADQQNTSRLRNGFPKLRTFSEDMPSSSRPWGCMQMGGCVEGAVYTPPRSTLLLLDRNRMRDSLSLKTYSGKEFPGKVRKSGSNSPQLLTGKLIDVGLIGCSNTKVGPSING